MRLIDADKINYHEHTECMGHGDFETVRTVTDKEIAEIPTVETVEVVRCRDCKRCFKNTTKRNRQKMWICMRNEVDVCVRPDDFCSYGERKDGYGNG